LGVNSRFEGSGSPPGMLISPSPGVASLALRLWGVESSPPPGSLIFAIHDPEDTDANIVAEKDPLEGKIKSESEYVPRAGKVKYDRGRGITATPQAVASFICQTNDGKITENRRLIYPNRGKITPKSIVLHSSNTKTFTRAMKLMEMFGFAVHLMIDVDGRVYQLMDALDDRGWAARGIDDRAIHVEVIGKSSNDSFANNSKSPKCIMENTIQLEAVLKTVEWLAMTYDIPKNNYDVEKNGIFPHYQLKKRFGGIVEDDALDPGPQYTKMIIEGIDGKYYPESKWKDRYTTKYKFHPIGKSIKVVHTDDDSSVDTDDDKKEKLKKVGPSRKGSGLTDAPKPDLDLFEVDDDGNISSDGRLRYKNRGRMKVTGVVLHFTATKSLDFTIRVLNQRNLCSNILVDTDGKAYQSMDSLEDIAAAAIGTNENCIQIEIIGMDENDLLGNKKQKEIVIKLVEAICKKYKIQKNNYDIESNEGIFSHGQAKKKWGRSAWLYGSTFDPGERYMKEVIEAVEGEYYYDMEPFVEDNNFSKYFYDNALGDDIIKSIEDVYNKDKSTIGTKLWKDRYNTDWVFLPYPWIP